MKNNRLIQVLCLIFGIFLLTCFSESHAEASDAGIHDHSHEGVYGEWLPWESSSSLPTGGGNYYLTKNVVLDGYSEIEYLEVGGNLNLCLNGYTITQCNENPAINVNMNGKFGLYDNESNSGSIRHGYFKVYEASGQTYTYFAHGPAVNVSSYGQFNMYGGRIKGNTLGVSVSGTSAIFNMHGGIIEENTDYQDGPGGGIQILNGGTFNLHNGLIQENASQRGSGVDVGNGTFNMYGGIIRNNRISPPI